MSESLRASCYADRACFTKAPILENALLARDTYRVRVEAPEIARRITPGQFVMIRLAGLNDPLLGRALAVYDVVRDATGTPIGVDLVYLVHGKLTTALAQRGPGDRVELWGPLGNGFAAEDQAVARVDHLLLVAGGIGQTPFLALGKEALGAQSYGDASFGEPSERTPIRADRVTLCYGVRTAELLAGADDFRRAGLDLRVASDDGSVGHHGLVTDLLVKALEESADERALVACCGPEPMMEAVAGVCREQQTPCLVSLETPMACGVGICFSCVARVVQSEDGQADDEWDYKRTCVEGPVFDAAKIVW